ncbi:MAG: NADH-quinone oxidoreductase subunit N [Gemmatimonadota bacterium]|nr:MAG: NADH-quinone oxidoreductase subunit N [Gemmatimonadota bacterium]
MGPQIDMSGPGGLALALLPELVLTGWCLVLMLVAAWRHKSEGDQRLIGRLAVVGLVATLVVVLGFWVLGVSPAGPEPMIALDRFRYFCDAIFLLGAILAALLSLGYLGRERVLVPEYYLLLLFATVGMMFMGGSSNLVMIFLGLELMSVSVYVLAGIDRRSVFAAEASLKYFLLGAFASGFLLYGIALIYGSTGTTDLTLIYARITALGLESNAMLLVGTGLLLVGFAFKVAAVPFHMWTPDVYDGAPTPITAFMAAAVKAAAFAAMIRVLLQGLGPADLVWTEIVWWLAAITMVVGNLIALVQRHIKRMLAYSSIGHAGYLLAAVAAGTEFGAAAFLFYVFAYTLMTVGAFAVLAAAGRRGEREVRVDDLNGLAKRRPWMAAAMTIFMLSLLGFPGTAGFIGKWLILSAAVQAGQGSLAVILVGSTVISAGFYLPIVMAMYMKPPATDTVHEETALVGASRWVVAALALGLLVFGVWPNRVLDVARQGTEDLKPSVTMTVAR